MIPAFPAILESPFLTLYKVYIVISSLYDTTNPFFFSPGRLGLEIVVLPCSLLNGLFSSSCLPCAYNTGKAKHFLSWLKLSFELVGCEELHILG